MHASFIVNSQDPDAYDAVFTALIEYHPNEAISVRAVLAEVRRLAPGCASSDDEIVALIVQLATGSTMGVTFDQRDAA